MPNSNEPSLRHPPAELIRRHNICVESFFSSFNGVFLGLTIFVAPVVAVVGLDANPLELTILVCAYPLGAFLGPVWAILGRRLGMKNLVTLMATLASLPMLLIFWVHDAMVFTLLVTFAQLMVSAMRMGQSSMYRISYPKELRGRMLGRLTFWTYMTLVPCVLLTGWLLDKSREMYRILYPLAGVCELFAAYCYAQIVIPHLEEKKNRPRFSLNGNLQNIERIVSQDKLYMHFQLAFFLVGGSFFMTRHVVILLAREQFEFSALELALCLSVLPQLLLAVSSPMWGRILDHIGIMRCRVLISSMLGASLIMFFSGFLLGLPILLYLGAILRGTSEGGGQLTWFLASTSFAHRSEDVPLYNGIHFVLNGTRGLILPWVGSILFVLIGFSEVLVAGVLCLLSLPIVLRALTFNDDRLQKATIKPNTVSELASHPPFGKELRSDTAPMTTKSAP